MKQPELGLCFYPTTVGLVDDDKAYMKKLLFRLVGEEQLSCLTYGKPEEALDFLTKQYQSDSFINRCLINQESRKFDHLVAELDIPAIHKEIFNPQRHNEVSVLVIDFAMPKINGLELARSIRKSNPYIKIIMLTGEAGHSLAVDAFNERSIDHFILKSDPNVLEMLVQAICTSQIEYFLNLSTMALNKIANFSKDRLACLSDPIFVDFFKQLCSTHKLIEYYLLDSHGSFILLDAQGKPSVLAVADEYMMETYQQLVKDDDAPQSIIDALDNKQMIPYFHTADDFTTPPAEWESYLHPAKMLQGKETYCYAYIADLVDYELARNKIVSYQQFLEKVRRQQSGI
jgi:CheY-like chemotaxis protein